MCCPPAGCRGSWGSDILTELCWLRQCLLEQGRCFRNSAGRRVQPAGSRLGNCAHTAPCRHKYTCMGCRCRSAGLPLKCWPSAVSELQRLLGPDCRGGAPWELGKPAGSGAARQTGYTCTLASFWHDASHILMSHWPPKWKRKRTKAAPLYSELKRLWMFPQSQRCCYVVLARPLQEPTEDTNPALEKGKWGFCTAQPLPFQTAASNLRFSPLFSKSPLGTSLYLHSYGWAGYCVFVW